MSAVLNVCVAGLQCAMLPPTLTILDVLLFIVQES